MISKKRYARSTSCVRASSFEVSTPSWCSLCLHTFVRSFTKSGSPLTSTDKLEPSLVSYT